jgi:hypothetical protein
MATQPMLVTCRRHKMFYNSGIRLTPLIWFYVLYLSEKLGHSKYHKGEFLVHIVGPMGLSLVGTLISDQTLCSHTTPLSERYTPISYRFSSSVFFVFKNRYLRRRRENASGYEDA